MGVPAQRPLVGFGRGRGSFGGGSVGGGPGVPSGVAALPAVGFGLLASGGVLEGSVTLAVPLPPTVPRPRRDDEAVAPSPLVQDSPWTSCLLGENWGLHWSPPRASSGRGSGSALGYRGSGSEWRGSRGALGASGRSCRGSGSSEGNGKAVVND